MKRRQSCRENDEEAIKKRREAIVDRALLYAHLLAVIDKQSKEDNGEETAVAENDEEVSQETGEEQQCSEDRAIESSQTLASEINDTHCCLRRPYPVGYGYITVQIVN